MKKERNLSMLSNLDWIGIEYWLSPTNDRKTRTCPFCEDHSKCEMLFPGTIYGDKKNIDFECPCQRLGLVEVIEVAKEILVEMKAAQE